MEFYSARLERDIGMITGVAAAAGKVAVKTVEAVAAVGKAAGKWSNYRPPRHTLMPCPAGGAVQAQWEKARHGRSVLEALKLGGMLLNVTQYVDSSPIYGKGKHIVARNPGVKGWLRDNCSGVTYKTAISYRKLAEITRAAISLPEFIPIEWVMPGTEADDEKRELNPENKAVMKLKRGEILRRIRECRGKLRRLLDGTGSMNQLFMRLDKATGGHRHRVYSKTAPVCKTAEERLIASMTTSLKDADSIPPGESLEHLDDLLELAADLQRRLQSLKPQPLTPPPRNLP